MKEKKSEKTKSGKQYKASTLAACSVAQYFKEKEWKIISFFPNSKCCQKKTLNPKKNGCKNCSDSSLENTRK